MDNNLSEENQQLLEEKVAHLEKALILENRADERFRLKQELKELKELKKLKINKNQYIIGLFLLVALFIWKNNKFLIIEPQTPSSFKIIGLETTSINEYLIKLNPPITERVGMLRVDGEEPLTIALSTNFPNNIFYTNLYDKPPEIKPNEQASFNIGIKLSLIQEKPRSQYQFIIEGRNQETILRQKTPLIVELNEWVNVINSLIETINKKLSSLPEKSFEAERKVTFDLIKETFPKTNVLIQTALTAQALQLVNRPESAALVYFEAEETKTGIVEQFLTEQQNLAIRTEIGKLYVAKQNHTRAVSWFNKAAEKNYAPAQYQLGLLYQKGEGVEKDINKAQELFDKSKENQNNSIHNQPIENSIKPLPMKIMRGKNPTALELQHEITLFKTKLNNVQTLFTTQNCERCDLSQLFIRTLKFDFPIESDLFSKVSIGKWFPVYYSFDWDSKLPNIYFPYIKKHQKYMAYVIDTNPVYFILVLVGVDNHLVNYIWNSALAIDLDNIGLSSSWEILRGNVKPANFEKANFERTVFMSVKFGGVNLKEANFKDSIFINGGFPFSNLEKANFEGARFNSTTNFILTNLTEANLEGVSIERGLFTMTNFTKASLERANLNLSHINGAILTQTNFKEANLTGVDFKGTNLDEANFEGANLTGIVIK